MARVTTNDLLDALREYGKAQARRPSGDGWYTVEELANQGGATIAATKYRLRTAMERGCKIETASGTALDSEGRAKRAAFYRFKGKP